MHWKTNDKCIFQDGEAHGLYLVSVCSPVRCTACHGLDRSIITMTNVRRRTSVANRYSGSGGSFTWRDYVLGKEHLWCLLHFFAPLCAFSTNCTWDTLPFPLAPWVWMHLFLFYESYCRPAFTKVQMFSNLPTTTDWRQLKHNTCLVMVRHSALGWSWEKIIILVEYLKWLKWLAPMSWNPNHPLTKVLENALGSHLYMNIQVTFGRQNWSEKNWFNSVVILKGPYQSIFDFSPLAEITTIFYKA